MIEIQLMDAAVLLMIGMSAVFIILGLLVYGMKTLRQLSCHLEPDTLRLHIN